LWNNVYYSPQISSSHLPYTINVCLSFSALSQSLFFVYIYYFLTTSSKMFHLIISLRSKAFCFCFSSTIVHIRLFPMFTRCKLPMNISPATAAALCNYLLSPLVLHPPSAVYGCLADREASLD
jgi:hypothetical protein